MRLVPLAKAPFGVSFVALALAGCSPEPGLLVDGSGQVVEFLSYEGTLTAANGPAAGITSVDIGVGESSSTPSTHSLQLTGSGLTAPEFTWQGPVTNTRGAPNTGQTFTSASASG